MKILKKLSAVLTATALAAAMLAAYTAPASAVVTVDDGVFQCCVITLCINGYSCLTNIYLRQIIGKAVKFLRQRHNDQISVGSGVGKGSGFYRDVQWCKQPLDFT